MINPIELLKVVFLGVVEGVTEWLPISSTGHMLLVDEFLQMNVSPLSRRCSWWSSSWGPSWR